MTTATSTVRLAADQRTAAADMLTRAFSDDPLTLYMLPDEATRSAKFHWLASVMLRAGLMFGEVYTTPVGLDGAAVWMPPRDRSKMTLTQVIRAGLAAAPFRLGWGPFRRFINVSNHVERLRGLEPTHWYLLMLGVEPARQRQGLGGVLIEPVLTRADADRIPCYLETTKARNVPFYQKHGFEVVVEDNVPKSGLHFWTMRRQPRRSA